MIYTRFLQEPSKFLNISYIKHILDYHKKKAMAAFILESIFLCRASQGLIRGSMYQCVTASSVGELVGELVGKVWLHQYHRKIDTENTDNRTEALLHSLELFDNFLQNIY